MLFTIFELVDIVIMTAVIGYIFKDTFRVPPHTEHKKNAKTDDVLEQYRAPHKVVWNDFWWACALVGPAVILHELGHKFAAMSFGMNATFHAACSSANIFSGTFFDFFCGLTIASVVLKAIGFGFIFFVPGYVSSSGGTHLQNAIVSVAGPFIHLVFWLGAAYLLRSKRLNKKMAFKRRAFLFFFKQINMFLFILNMIPIPGFDGFNFFYHLVKAFIG